MHRLGRGDDELKAEVPLKTGPCHSDPACAGNGGPGLSENVFPPPPPKKSGNENFINENHLVFKS